MFTADGTYRRGNVVPLKPLADQAALERVPVLLLPDWSAVVVPLPSGAQRAKRAFERGLRPQRLNCHVHALAIGDPLDFLGEVGGAIVDRVLDALGPDRVVLGARGGPEDLSPNLPGDLGRGDADAPAGRG